MTTAAADDPRLLFTGPSPFGWHRYEAFMRCPASYAFDQEARARGDVNDAPALVQGTLVHLGLAHHYARRRAEQNPDDPSLDAARDLYRPGEAVKVLAEREIATRTSPAAREVWQTAAATAQRVVSAYAVHYAAERLRVEAVEEVFALDLGDGASLTMRIDLVASDRQGRIYLIDHKTTGRLTSNHPVQYGASGQFLAYSTLGRLLWPDRFGGLILNMIEIQGERTTFDRPAIQIGPGRLAAFIPSVRDVARRMAALRDVPAADWPRNTTENTCWTRYGACPHLGVCGATMPTQADRA